MSDILLTAAQMRAWERAAIEAGAVTGLELMERAGAGAVGAILAAWPELAEGGPRAVVLCGPGNNGGDGFVVARLLRERGWAVEVFLYGDLDNLPPDARANYERWCEGGEVKPITACTSERWLPDPHHGHPLVVDAVFGIGLTRPTPDDVFAVMSATLHCRCVALDVPSVLNSDSGRLARPWPHGDPAARLTLTFGAAKTGHYLADGPAVCGAIRVVDIGLAADAARRGQSGPQPRVDTKPSPGGGGERSRQRPDEGRPDAGGDPAWPSHEAVVRSVGVDPRLSKRSGHKYDHGHTLVLTGGFGRTGAARLSARAALRIGAGLVTVAAPGAAMMECAAQLTAIMLRRCDDADGLRALLEDDRLNALCLGPGLGTDDRAGGLVAAALESGRKLVLDADALSLVAGDDALRGALHGGCVLTPHMGEFARLYPDLAGRLKGPATEGPAYSKVDAARDAAAGLRCTLLIKGPDTVIADPSGRASVNAAVYGRAAPWLATAGAGDVLAGMVAGLLARGFAPHDAAASAAWLHVEAARSFGPGLIAEDLPDAIPAILRRLEG